jgi:prepilin-type N-terminal cleavage/methylation domain-containing protein
MNNSKCLAIGMTLHTEKRFAQVDTHEPDECRGGFSLLEVMGVLAVLAILAAVIFTATTKSVAATDSRQEGATIHSFANALQSSILRTRYIPGQNGISNWCQQIAEELGVSTNSVLFNIRNLTVPRVFIADPALSIGPGGTITAFPYRQDLRGSVQPGNHCRVMILSSLNKSFPPLPTFDQIWNTPDGSLPPGFVGWSPDDLRIERINLAPLFLKLSLANSESLGNPGQYQVDGAGVSSVPNPGGTNGYFLQSTTLDLLSEAALGGVTNARLVLVRDTTYFYVAKAWRDVPFSPVVAQTNIFAAGMAQKLSATASTLTFSPYNANSSATPPFVANAISNFMYAYAPYAAAAASSSNWTSGQLYNNASQAQSDMVTAMASLSSLPTVGGCTNAP